MILKFICLVLVSGLVFGQADFQLSYIAEQIDQYCDLRKGCGSSRPDPNVAPPRIGKAGPRGPKGVPGPAAEVDYSRIENSIDEKLRVIREEMAQMKIEIKRLSLCKVEYRKKCFWAITTTLPAAQARELCESEGGKAANIYDTTHFEMIRKYLVTLMFVNDNFLHTGMDYDPQAGIVTLANGTQTSVSKWRYGYPSATSTRTVMVFGVWLDPNNKYCGMWNGPPSYTLHGVLCEI